MTYKAPAMEMLSCFHFNNLVASFPDELLVAVLKESPWKDGKLILGWFDEREVP